MTRRYRTLTLILCAFALIGVFVQTSPALAQKTEYLEWKFGGDEKLKNLVEKALKKDIDEFKNQFGSMPMFQTATGDLNGDGKPEIFARFTEEYYFRDNRDNTKTYIYAYTKRGLIKIFDAMAGDLAIGKKDQSGLREIVAFKGLTPQYDIYKWDGKRRYVKK